MKKLVSIKLIGLFVLFSFLGQAQTDQEYDLEESFSQIQRQMEQMLEEIGQNGGSIFFSDTLFAPGPMNLDSLMQGSWSLFPPGFGPDSLANSPDSFFGGDMQDQLNQMFQSLDDLDPQYFQGLEDLMRQFDQNGIRPDSEEIMPRKNGKVKKKIYKI